MNSVAAQRAGSSPRPSIRGDFHSERAEELIRSPFRCERAREHAPLELDQLRRDRHILAEGALEPIGLVLREEGHQPRHQQREEDDQVEDALVYGFVGIVVGAIALAIGVATGFVLCIAIPILICSPFVILWGVVQVVYPAIRLGHLGSGSRRETAIQHIENEARASGTVYQKTRQGQMWLTRTWFAVFTHDEVMVVQRRDVLYIYLSVTRGRWSSSARVNVRTRGKDYSVGVDEVEQEGLVRTFANAAPWAFVGYDERLVALPAQQLASEVDHRMSRSG